jgi:hypothetical protein
LSEQRFQGHGSDPPSKGAVSGLEIVKGELEGDTDKVMDELFHGKPR